MTRLRYRLSMILIAPFALSGCVAGQIIHSSALKGTEHRIENALKEFDDGDYVAAARDCPVVYDELERKLSGTTGRYMDYVAARDNQKLLAMCAADSNAMLKNRAEACRWYPLGDNRTVLRSMNVARYCG